MDTRVQKLYKPQHFNWSQQQGIVDDAWQFYDENGFLIIHEFITKQICQQLMDQAGAIVYNHCQQEYQQHKNSDEEQPVVFSTRQRQHDKSRYFIESANDIRCFYEELAIADDGSLTGEKPYTINKIGHALHRFDPVFKQFVESRQLNQLIDQLPLSAPSIIQSMIIFKQPYIGGEVNCHQDATFLYTEPTSVVGLWLALEDATIENGCLYAIPGGHKQGLTQRYCNQNGEMHMVDIQKLEWDISTAIPLEVKQGSLIVLNGLLPHFSEQNYSSRSRQALTLHIIDKACHYLEDNWLQVNN
ncbi:phytanoyl-CoA dioxygenase family protein [Endozoicomonas sp. SM1973]|uniref:Phytanoyl-CoA dioxygenase family protein n=1 Tax=Spartinivicinus marinus TaxID=2994442 RepID=A0A853IG19_9GAMM|nr:phytanoyl-CoA dioxygenase family protein [Spartinivicinus marinus]MCX4025358.1 phytanoyl-CoA dioxygenase family protein [Spartinivicinus marinus]NYZ68931.1 phytanoyl-CoA dioxygenase family protein [Spartinivicinus marinus]